MNEKNCSTNQKRTDIGQGLVEFALVLPVMLLIIWGIIEFGRMLIIYTEVSNAAREAVRYGVVRGADISGDPRYVDCQGIIDAGKQATAMAYLEDDNFAIGYDHGGGATIDTCPPSTAIEFGDRLVITVTNEVKPLILFQDAGPFQIQFVAARTIVQEGIPLGEGHGTTTGDGDDTGGDEAGPGEASAPTPGLDTDTCQVVFTWPSVPDADGYHLYRLVPTPTMQINGDILGLQYPVSGGMTVSNGEQYAVRAYDASGEGAMSNPTTISGCNTLPDIPQDLVFSLEQADPCQGYLSWSAVSGATGYRIYETTAGLVADVTTPPYPSGSNMPVANNQEYRVAAYSAAGEGELSLPVTVSGCTAAVPAAPANLVFTPDTGETCIGHFSWDPVAEASGYHVFEASLGQVSGDLATNRYPESGSVSLNDGEQYTVRAFADGGESGPSNTFIATGCSAGPQDYAFYLHTSWLPGSVCGDHDGAPAPWLTMGTRTPFCSLQEYDYNNDGASPTGRQIAPGGVGPAGNSAHGEADASRYLAWASDPFDTNVTLQGNASVTLYYINPDLGKDLLGSLYLCQYSDATSSYQNCTSTAITFGKKELSWTQISASLPPLTIQSGNRLALYLVHDGGVQNILPLWLIYDSNYGPGYMSQIEFVGE